MLQHIARYKQLERIAKLYLFSQFLRALYFAWPIWYAFASQALQPFQIGLYFSVAYGTQLIAEVPTGALADKYGRKRSAVLGSLLLAFVPLVMYFGHTFPAYMVCAVLYGLGLAFISGSLEALVYDHANISKQTFRTITWLEITIFQVGLIASAATGGLLYQQAHVLPFMAEALACLTCFITILAMRETPLPAQAKSNESYGRYFKTGIKHLLATRYLRMLVLMGVPLGVMVTICIEYINEAQMIEYGLPPATRGLLIGSVKVIALLVINIVLYRLLRFDRARLLFLAFTSTVVFAVLGIRSLPLFLVAYVGFNWVSATQLSFIKPILHDNLPSSHRATAMSGFSALMGLGAVAGNAGAGALVQVFDTPRAVYVVCAALFVLLIIPCALWLAAHLKNTADRLEESASSTEVGEIPASPVQ